jgi:hypothetical protein
MTEPITLRVSLPAHDTSALDFPRNTVEQAELLAQTDSQAMLADAAEELTFQFSETVEAQQHSLEERLADRAELQAESNLSVEQVQYVLRLMEGHEGYSQLRMQARAFADAMHRDPQHAQSLLRLESMPPAQRYAVLRLAMDALEQSGHLAGARQIRDEHGSALDVGAKSFECQEGVARLASHAAAVQRSAADHRDELEESYYQLIGTQPSARSVFDAAAEFDGLEHLEASLGAMQMSWAGRPPLSGLDELGCLVIVNRLAEVVRTMIASAHELLSALGAHHGGDVSLPIRHARSLIDLASSSVPSGPLDRLAAALLDTPRRCPRCSLPRGLRCSGCGSFRALCHCTPTGACTCADAKPFFFSLLHHQARRWPDAVWAAADGRKHLLEQLVRKQADQRSRSAWMRDTGLARR